MILGKGAAYARADEEIRSFIETTGMPFLPMSMAKGLLPDDHPQSAAAARSYAIGNADVVMLAGARLNWLLSHGRPPLWSEGTRFVQVDISPTEIDSNRAIAAPVVGDIKSVFAAFNAAMKPGQVRRQAAWMDEIGKRKQQNIERMAARLNADPSPMNFSSALRAVRNALATQPDVYVVNEGANTLDFGRNIIDMDKPRHRLDSGTWGVMGIGMGYAIGAAAVTGKPVVAIEGDSAFGFSGMEIETICRYELPVIDGHLQQQRRLPRRRARTAPYSPTGLLRDARYEKIIEAFGGAGYHVTDTPSLTKAAERGARVRQAGADQCRHRPDGRHRERAHPEPQSTERCRPGVIDADAVATARLGARGAARLSALGADLVRRSGRASRLFPGRVRRAAPMARRAGLCRHRGALPVSAGTRQQPGRDQPRHPARRPAGGLCRLARLYDAVGRWR